MDTDETNKTITTSTMDTDETNKTITTSTMDTDETNKANHTTADCLPKALCIH